LLVDAHRIFKVMSGLAMVCADFARASALRLESESRGRRLVEGVWGAWENEDGESVVIDEESDAVALEEFVRAKNSDTPQAVVSVEVGAISYRARCASPHQLQRRAQPREARGRTSGSAGETGPRVL